MSVDELCIYPGPLVVPLGKLANPAIVKTRTWIDGDRFLLSLFHAPHSHV